MEQRKRFGGNSGLGYYTSWEKSKNNGCIYCGNPATTREHVPSKVFYQLDEQRFDRILLKLARGHAGFEYDYVDFDNTRTKIWYDFLFDMNENNLMNFEVIPEIDIAPEVGSRGITTPFILQNIATGDAIGFSAWNEVQENRYRYQVSHNENGDITVKIVIFEFLYCVVEFGT